MEEDKEMEGAVHCLAWIGRSGLNGLKLECHVNSGRCIHKIEPSRNVDRPPPGESLRISPLFFREAEITDSVNEMSQ